MVCCRRTLLDHSLLVLELELLQLRCVHDCSRSRYCIIFYTMFISGKTFRQLAVDLAPQGAKICRHQEEVQQAISPP